ncbi:50S ribosomal protein L35 [bacterium]|nr:50S ribosomal protein L35 [bacterium]
MPKMKTHRAGAKRYKLTGTGKILRRQAGTKHLLQHKSQSRKNRLSSMVEVSDTHKKLVQKQLPYAKKYN